MTNYSINPGHVRGELFTENGKWKYTVVIDMSDHWNDPDLHRTIVEAIRKTDSTFRGVVDSAVGSKSSYWLVVLDPYNRFGHPQMIKLSSYKEEL